MVPWRNVPRRNVLGLNALGWNVHATEWSLGQSVLGKEYPFGTDSPSQIFFDKRTIITYTHFKSVPNFFHKTDQTSPNFLWYRIAIGKQSKPEPHHFPVPEREPEPHQDNAAPQHYFKALIYLNLSAGAGIVPPGPRQGHAASPGLPGPGRQGSSRGPETHKEYYWLCCTCCKQGWRNVYNKKCVRNQNARFLWVRDVLS
jgi:hypothetical protein